VSQQYDFLFLRYFDLQYFDQNKH